MSNPNLYTIAWVAAVRVEFVAALSFLDEEHPQPAYIHPQDENNYALGTIHGHKVVIATLPDAGYGVPDASRVAQQVKLSFPNIQFGLMVGIGGGAPSRKNDIRLGDIVVGEPRDGDTGVFEYEVRDLGNQLGKRISATRRLTPPPPVLRAAVAQLKRQYANQGHRIPQAVEDVLAMGPRLRAEFQRPHPATDRLFRSNVLCHSNSQGHDAELAARSPRPTSDSTVIHYGTIASANRLMKDSSLRDQLITSENVLCFEMEAAGLMDRDDFPCLVIRGICDYSDSHKNDVWQGYAAMVAAAYAKDLLTLIADKQSYGKSPLASRHPH
ncbi:purine and uridine phosphorylase [Aspergillus karnatakaensis]|uniref:purine and uridine phosphorylase n=1 Tax=Aspergillus karnatakaensis TaxID=1810916 RepID=UPI003CCCC106